MKFFKCHSKKLLENKVLIVHDKFTDIGPDVFQGCTSEAVKLGSQTRVIRNYAFSGIKNCSVLLPETIEEIESLAFDGLGSDVIFFCKENSYAHNYCTQYGLNVSFDCDKINIMAEEFCNEEKNKAVVSESVVIHEPVINKEEKFVVSESTENNVNLAFSPLKTDDNIVEQQKNVIPVLIDPEIKNEVKAAFQKVREDAVKKSQDFKADFQKSTGRCC